MRLRPCDSCGAFVDITTLSTHRATCAGAIARLATSRISGVRSRPAEAEERTSPAEGRRHPSKHSKGNGKPLAKSDSRTSKSAHKRAAYRKACVSPKALETLSRLLDAPAPAPLTLTTNRSTTKYVQGRCENCAAPGKVFHRFAQSSRGPVSICSACAESLAARSGLRGDLSGRWLRG